MMEKLLLKVFVVFCSIAFAQLHDYPAIQIGNGSLYTIDELTNALENETSETVSLYFESGIHNLSNIVRFNSNVMKTEFHGDSYSKPSVIQCDNGAGILFNEDQSHVKISNIIFNNCNVQNIKGTAVYLKNVDTCILENVTLNANKYYAHCSNQSLRNCKLITATLSCPHNAVLNISDTLFHDGQGLLIDCSQCSISIANCNFMHNKSSSKGYHARISIFNSTDNVTDIAISNCTFSATICGGGSNIALDIRAMYNEVNLVKAAIKNCKFTCNHHGLAIVQVSSVSIASSVFANNTGIALFVQTAPPQKMRDSNVSGLDIWSTKISNCTFQNHTARNTVVITAHDRDKESAVSVESTTFEWNSYAALECWVMRIENIKNATFKNLIINENYCTGIAVVSSNITVQEYLNVTNNVGMYGGALSFDCLSAKTQPLKLSFMNLENKSQLNLINNTAKIYGGAIFVGKQCEYKECLIKYEKTSEMKLLGNSAHNGGDTIFGGKPLSCQHNQENNMSNAFNMDNIFWDSTTATLSQSVIADYPTKVVFCSNTTEYRKIKCKDNDVTHAYRGKVFTISMMYADAACFPSASSSIIASTNTTARLQIESEHQPSDSVLQPSKKYCANYSYSITADQSIRSATVLLQKLFNHLTPATLTIILDECPRAFPLNLTKCACHPNITEHYADIRCNLINFTLTVPAPIWIGKKGEELVIQKNCMHCKSEGNTTLEIQDIENLSPKLCNPERNGTLCSGCTQNHSLKLGGYNCGICSNQGLLLLLWFAAAGIILIIVLFTLNLTVSTGLLNGLIFYCNMVYLSTDIFLPLNLTDQAKGMQYSFLHYVAKFLLIFLSWINLDFGISTCFYNGYDIYTSAWLQFVFPFYIWTLIAIIVAASKYSRKISKLTTSNTVPVLATLLKLSYAKLLIACIQAASFSEVIILSHYPKTIKLWHLDGTIPFLSPWHIPLFIMSLTITILYLIPFTFLILFGPALLARSDRKPLHWINRIKPLLDAFYGPYTKRYRNWNGVLLLTRIFMLPFSIYTVDDSCYQPMVMVVLATTLLASWIALGKRLSIYTKAYLNYLELFFHFNLAVLSILSSYLWSIENTHIWPKQILGVVMVGAVFIAFCSIIVYQGYQTIFKQVKLSRAAKVIVEDVPENTNNFATTATHSNLELRECISVSGELREPLLSSQ